ncbi:MAG: hypothetical protein HUJ80_06605 [Firmicutes bacterium]|nr:hypothetical protein [Bacillota bacterium]
MSYLTEKYLLWVLLSLPVMAICVAVFAEMKHYVDRLERSKRRKEELKKQQEQAMKNEEERRRLFEEEYRRSRGGRQQ